jgi:DNA modification methylase
MPTARLMLGDCLVRMAEIPDGSVDAVIADPPYPEINRPYGRMTEGEWHAMMRGVVAHCRRILKPTGSAVFVLQPNSERVGRMRPWLFEFQAWACREWNMVQDVHWWNFTALPTVHCHRDRGLMRPSVKACVWLGPPDCYRDQEAVLWSESQDNAAHTKMTSALRYRPSGYSYRDDRARQTCRERGGTSPFNLIPIMATGEAGHPASTPEPLCDWWVRYISPPDGVACDPFMGSGTTGLAALKRGRSFIGIERDPDYFAVTEHRIAAVQAEMPLFPATA